MLLHYHLVEKILPGFKDKVKEIFSSIIDWVKRMWDSIKGIWNSIISVLGFGDSKAEITVTKEGEETEDGKVTEKVKETTKSEVTKVKDSKIAEVTQVKEDLLFKPKYDTKGNTQENGIIGGGGATKEINMHLDIKNYFTLNPGDWREGIDEIADRVVGKINDRMRDSAIALG